MGIFNRNTGKTKVKTISIENAFESIEEMFLYNYDQYRKTLDLNWFVRGYDGRQTKLNPELLEPIKDKINDQWERLQKNPHVEIRNGKEAKIKALMIKYDTVNILIGRMAQGFGATMQEQEIRFKYIQQIEKWGFKIKIISDPLEDLEQLFKIQNQLKGIRTQVNIILEELKKDGEEQSISLNKQLIIISSALMLGYQLNARKITLTQWFDYCELAEEKAKQN